MESSPSTFIFNFLKISIRYDICDNKGWCVLYTIFLPKEVLIMKKLINDIYATINESSRWVDDFCDSLSGDIYDRMDTYGMDYEDASDINIGILWSERLA